MTQHVSPAGVDPVVLWRWVMRAAVTAIAAAILLTVIPIGAVVDALRRVSVWTWTGALAIFFAGHYANGVKLRLLLGQETVSSAVCVQAQYAGLVANLGLPGLAGGDLVRGAYLIPVVGTKVVVLSSVVDRLIDTCTLVVLMVLAIPIAGAPPLIAGPIHVGSWWLGVGAVAGVLLAFISWRVRGHPAIAQRLAQGWTLLRTRQAALGGAVVISLLVQSVFVLTNAWLARDVGVATGLAAWFVAWPLSKLIAVLPISLGGIGVREAALVALLAPYGAPREAVLASGILWQAILIVSGVAGLIVTQVLRRAVPSPPRVSSSPVER